jgi:hypothetical protein
MNKVKVVHIITKMELGGAQQNTLHTVSHLNPNKFQVNSMRRRCHGEIPWWHRIWFVKSGRYRI